MQIREPIPSSNTEAAVDDLAPLAWVLPEVERTLMLAIAELQAIDELSAQFNGNWEQVNVKVLEHRDSLFSKAKTYFYQVRGALSLVGQKGAADCAAQMELTSERFALYPELCIKPNIIKLQKLSHAITQFLQSILAKRASSAVTLFVQYKDVCELAKNSRIHPANLWENSHSQQWLTPSVDASADPLEHTPRVSEQLNMHLLDYLRTGNVEAISDLRLITFGLLRSSLAQSKPSVYSFWIVASALLDALFCKVLPSDVYAKRALSGIAMQFGQLQKKLDQGQISPVLLHELLFFCAQASHRVQHNEIKGVDWGALPALKAVSQAWQLQKHKYVDYETIYYGRFDPTLLAQIRKQIAQAKVAWTGLSAGDVQQIRNTADSFKQLSQSLCMLYPTSDILAQEFENVVEFIIEKRAAPSPELGMEVATAILYLEAVFEDLDTSETIMSERSARLAQRIEQARHGQRVEAVESWIEDLYRRVSEKESIGSIVGELRTILTEVEGIIDQYFRIPKDVTILRPISDKLFQTKGILSVLGLEHGVRAVSRMRETIESFLLPDFNFANAKESKIFERLGGNLGALSFMVDMLNYQPSLVKKLFVYDSGKDELTALVGRLSPAVTMADWVTPDMQDVQKTTRANETSATQQSIDQPSEREVKEIEAAREKAKYEELKKSQQISTHVDEVLKIDASTDKVSQAEQEISDIKTSTTAPLSSEEKEMREIFLEEAKEVIAAGLEALKGLDANEDNIENKANLRRAFHTLKGSARMVGLSEFGEAAWALEYLINVCLSENRTIDSAIRSLCSDALGLMNEWVLDVEQQQDGLWVATTFRYAADAMRLESRLVKLGLQHEVEGRLACVVSGNNLEDQEDTKKKIRSLDTHESDSLIPNFSGVTKTDEASLFESETLTGLLTEPLQITDSKKDEQNLIHAAQKIELDWDLGESCLDVDVGIEKQSLLDNDDIIPLQTIESIEAVDNLDGALIKNSSVSEENLSEQQQVQVNTPSTASEDAMELKASEEQYKIIDGLEIPLPLYSVYVQEADEWIRALILCMDEWYLSLETGHQFLPQDAIFYAHSLAGSSGVVGLTALSGLARELEMSLEHVKHWKMYPESILVTLLQTCAHIRYLFQQFNAGFLQSVPALLLQQLREIQNTTGDVDEMHRENDFSSSVFLGVAPALPIDEFASNYTNHLGTHAGVQGDNKKSTPIGPANFSALSEHLENLAFEQVAAPTSENDHNLFDNGDLVEAPLDLQPEVENPLDAFIHDATQNPDRNSSGDTNVSDLNTVAEENETLASEDKSDKSTEKSLLAQHASFESLNDALATMKAFGSQTVEDRANENNSSLSTHFINQPVPHLPVHAAVTSVNSHLDIDNEIDAVDGIDSELFVFFEEEAKELLPNISRNIQTWMDDLAHKGLYSQILRDLHTLKGSARLAGAMRIGEMAHRMESDIQIIPEQGFHKKDLEHFLFLWDGLESTFDKLTNTAETNFTDALSNIPNTIQQIEDETQSYPIQKQSQSAKLLGQVDDLRSPGLIEGLEAFSEAAITKQASFVSHETLQTAPQPSPKDIDEKSEVNNGFLQNFAKLEKQEINTSGLTTIDTSLSEWKPSTFHASHTIKTSRERKDDRQSVRVRSKLLDHLLNQAGEVMLTRTRLDEELGQLRGSLGDLSGNLMRLREQLRDIELQAETQMQSRLAQVKDAEHGFDPLEFDRFTRVQELTRMMAESVNDVATVQRNLQKTIEATEDDLVAQARQTRELQRDLLRTRMDEFESISERLYRVVRSTAKETGKSVKLDIVGGRVEMDRSVLERMTPIFEHLLRNSVGHGIEQQTLRKAAGKDTTGTITIEVKRDANDIHLIFSDDGVGLNLSKIKQRAIERGLIDSNAHLSDAQIGNLIFSMGLSTADQVTELSGRGIGLDVVRSTVNSLGGRIEVNSQAGQGISFKLVLPATAVVTQIVLVRVGNLKFGIPSYVVDLVHRLPAADLKTAVQNAQLEIKGESYPFYWAGALLELSVRSSESHGKTEPVLVVRSAGQFVAVQVDEILGNFEVVVKELGPQLERLPGLAGVAVQASGGIVLIYNPVALATVYGSQAHMYARLTDNEESVSEVDEETRLPLSSTLEVANRPESATKQITVSSEGTLVPIQTKAHSESSTQTLVSTYQPSLMAPSVFGIQEPTFGDFLPTNISPQGAMASLLSNDAVLAEGQKEVITPMVRMPRFKAPSSENKPKEPLVMVVDDSMTVRRVTQKLLQNAGYRVVLAADGMQGLEKLQEEMPCVILTDIEMPRMDGFDFVRNLRANNQYMHLPVVMITSRIAEKHREVAKELGVNHYLGKPYQNDQLLALVAQFAK